MKIEYVSNKSGGSWWLKDRDWKVLEKNGWKVRWAKDEKPIKIGGRLSTINMADEDGRWLGTLAQRAAKNFKTVGDAIREFEKLTGQDASDEGCNCCGAPHSFKWGRALSDFRGKKDAEYGTCSGEECLKYLYKKVPTSLREAAAALSK